MNLLIRLACIIAFVFFITGCARNVSLCTAVDEAATSITVEKRNMPVVGLNTDTDSLNFGVVSPTASVERSIKVQYSRKADVSVKAEGDFSSWVEIDPAEFSLDGNIKKVTFTAKVPPAAEEGIYTGRMAFCFKE